MHERTNWSEVLVAGNDLHRLSNTRCILSDVQLLAAQAAWIWRAQQMQSAEAAEAAEAQLVCVER